MKYGCIIVDDEPYAREVLKDYISRAGCLDTIASFSDSSEALRYLTAGTTDLVFLDINMPQIDGLTLIRSLENPPAVILTTAYREYAIDGFDLRAIDYLLKPISFERFMRAVNHFLSLKNKESDGSNNIGGITGEDKFIYVRENKKTHRIPAGSILFIES